jgi:hypothetical protein
MPTPEHARLREIRDDIDLWRHWGPYLSDRAWGTVREDYSRDGEAWKYVPFDLARSKAFRWGEDAIGGISDRYQLLCFAPAFWNGRDPFLKERLFGLDSNEGNHGEDVKEYYFYLDNTPTHSYMSMLYKYPQQEFPYAELRKRNAQRNTRQPEFELIDTGIFSEDRYFDILIEYAKNDPDDLHILLSMTNRGPQAAPLHVVPQLWFRNIWGWTTETLPEPSVVAAASSSSFVALQADDANGTPLVGARHEYKLGPRMLYASPGGRLLFTDNETNAPVVFGPSAKSRKPFVKDGIDRAIVAGLDTVNTSPVGTKAAIQYEFAAIHPGETVTLELRLTNRLGLHDPLADVASTIALRRSEADRFYEALHPAKASPDERMIQRQALAGMLWSKQCYLFDVAKWQDGDEPAWAPSPERKDVRNLHWRHLNSMRVMPMPDKWEYPWFAAWDLAIQCIPLTLVDAQYAKDMLQVLLFEQFIHPNGQIPAYEWEFSDLNPPVHAWCVWRVYNMDRIRNGRGDREFLLRCFHKLLLNFTWWVNKVDRVGNNVFEGGFLGLDNIAVFDRSRPLPGGAVLEQSDATGWMGMFSLNLLRIALELAQQEPVYEALAVKFFQHYAMIARAMKNMGGRSYQLWDEDDGFFYDVLRYPDGKFTKFRIRSLVGLVPLFAVERLERTWIRKFPEFCQCIEWYIENRPGLVKDVVHKVERDGETTYVLTIVDSHQLVRILDRVWDPSEFLSDYGLRALSRAHLERPFVMDGCSVSYEPAEAIERLKGGNSNWRGPIWFPTTFLLIESLRKLSKAFGPGIRINGKSPTCPNATLPEATEQIANRLIRIFTRDASGRRAVFGGTEKFQTDPHWRDYLLFYEYFHGDNGAGLGASHQTGWTGLVASLIDEWRA